MKAGFFSHQTTALNKGQELGSLKPTEPCVCVCVCMCVHTHADIHNSALISTKPTYTVLNSFLLKQGICSKPLSSFAVFLLVCVFCNGFMCVCARVSPSVRPYLCAYQLRNLSLSPSPPNCICILIMSMFVQKHDRRSDMTKWK